MDVENHPYVRSLLETGKFTSSYPYSDEFVSEDRKSYSLTPGILMGKDKITPSPMALATKQEIVDETTYSELYVIYELGPKICGHKNIIHGGLLATLLDESLCRCGFAVLPNKVGVTASLNISYLAPTPANSLVVLKAHTTKVEGRKVWVEGATFLLPRAEDYNPNDELVKTVKAELLAVEPRWASKLTERATPTGQIKPNPQTNQQAEA
uniref:ARAD1D02750p n=1 Tax=Blastobotrys adeninivorans TaxID=409370 RepID=A0A060T7W8_BLAAD